MKKFILAISLVTGIWLLDTFFHLSRALLLFITIGVIPGTTISLSANCMLAIMSTTGAFVIASLIFSRSYQYLIVHYYVRHSFTGISNQFQLTTKTLGHWYHSVQSTPAKASTPEE